MKHPGIITLSLASAALAALSGCVTKEPVVTRQTTTTTTQTVRPVVPPATVTRETTVRTY